MLPSTFSCSRFVRCAVGTLIVLLTHPVTAQDARNFAANLSNCTEVIAFGPIPLANVQQLVPAAFTINLFGPTTAGLVIRASECNLTFGAAPETQVLVAQIGVSIASPDGTGQINNYSLLYETNNLSLWRALRSAGWPALYDPHLAYEFTPGTTGSGSVYIAVSPLDGPYFLEGDASPPPGPPAPVVANWWFASNGTNVKLATSIPAPGIAYGQATTTLFTSELTGLGALIGGNSDANFPFLNARGIFAQATLTVSNRR
jgi:hypothetical protein